MPTQKLRIIGSEYGLLLGVTMRQITIRIDDDDDSAIRFLANKHRKNINGQIRYLIRNGLLFDVPDKKLNVTTACAIEYCLLLRKLANLQDRHIVKAVAEDTQRILNQLDLKSDE